MTSPRAIPSWTVRVGLGLVTALAVTGCGAHSDRPATTPASPRPSASPTYDAARSSPRTDSVYPHVGNPVVDALHYGLDLTWSGTLLTGTETLELRATTDATRLTLDLSHALRASDVTLDGAPVTAAQVGDDLVIDAPVRAESRHVLTLSYTGPAAPVKDPSHREDAAPLGLTRTPDGGVWTMQEPYGASTWFAVDDQPADKAFYDVTVRAPAGMVGISNGMMTSRTDAASGTTTVWHSSAPMASYLTTLAIGAYTATKATSASGVPLTYWLPAGDTEALEDLSQTPKLLAWLEKRLGSYPFESLSLVIVPADSAMETQSTLTLGNLPDDHSPDVLLHEISHQWYGDDVTPADWRDLWMNEGMATYLQLTWQDQAWGRHRGDSLSDLTLFESDDRRAAGPPGAYKPDHFAEDNVYSGTAEMWDRIRRRVGDPTFWRLVRDWPAARAGQSVTRADYVAWLSQQAGVELAPLMTAWLMSPRSPR